MDQKQLTGDWKRDEKFSVSLKREWGLGTIAIAKRYNSNCKTLPQMDLLLVIRSANDFKNAKGNKVYMKLISERF